MSMPFFPASGKVTLLTLLASGIFQTTAQADWQRDETSIAWHSGANALWQFSFDPKKGKPFFNPVTPDGVYSLTNFKPADHPWHYGLWFSWKYINHVNYWEENRETGRAEGATHWNNPVIETQPDGSATIRMYLTYVNPSNQVDLMENRQLKISAPARDNSYTIDWYAEFIAGPRGATLDRTPMLGEPKGQTNGGYAGLGLRMAGLPLTMSVVCSTGLVTHFEGNRARPNARSVGFNFADGSKVVGGIAIFSNPNDAGINAPWYIVDSEQMRFVCAAILAPAVRTLAPGEKMALDYRIAVQPKHWTAKELEAQYSGWRRVQR